MSNEKQMIEEMAKFVCNACEMGGGFDGECALDNDYRKCHISVETAEALYNAGYRKQSEADNVAIHPSSAFECSECHWEDWDLGTADSTYNYCPNCGAKMKGGEEE